MASTDTATRVLENYVGGRWTASSSTERAGAPPPGGAHGPNPRQRRGDRPRAALARGRARRGGRRRAAGAARVAWGRRARARAQAVRAAREARRPPRGARTLRDHGDGQD